MLVLALAALALAALALCWKWLLVALISEAALKMQNHLNKFSNGICNKRGPQNDDGHRRKKINLFTSVMMAKATFSF